MPLGRGFWCSRFRAWEQLHLFGFITNVFLWTMPWRQQWGGQSWGPSPPPPGLLTILKHRIFEPHTRTCMRGHTCKYISPKGTNLEEIWLWESPDAHENYYMTELSSDISCLILQCCCTQRMAFQNTDSQPWIIAKQKWQLWKYFFVGHGGIILWFQY